METDNMSSKISDMEYSGKSPLEILPDYEKAKDSILAQKSIDYLDPYLYSVCFKELCWFASSNSKFKHSKELARFLIIFNKYFCNQAKRLDIALNLLKHSANKQEEELALGFLSMIVSIVDSNIKEATRARCQIGVASRLNMRKYYDPIRKYKNGKECRINEFRRQFDLYWNEHHLDIQERSQKRKKARKKQNQSSSSDAANSSQEKKKRPYQLYPDYFASFRTGFYRWENKYKEDAKNWRDQKKILKFIDKLKSMAPKKPEAPEEPGHL